MEFARFRALSKSNKEWVYGYYVKSVDTNLIYFNPQIYTNFGDYVDVYENTLGQYTGKIDYNSTEIFEGDIVQNSKTGTKAIVQYFPEHGAFMLWIKDENINSIEYLGEILTSELEVIGNIYENPELMPELTMEE